MKIPKYVIELMKRSQYYYDRVSNEEDYAAGYTVAIAKATPYTHIKSFRNEIEHLQAWVNRQTGGDCRIIHLPKKTHYCNQLAIVTIFDPVMKHIEQYIQQ